MHCHITGCAADPACGAAAKHLEVEMRCEKRRHRYDNNNAEYFSAWQILSLFACPQASVFVQHPTKCGTMEKNKSLHFD